MKKFLFVFLISCFSLTIISCAKKDDSSSSSSSSGATTDDTTTTTTTTSNICPAENWWQLMGSSGSSDGSTSRNVSLFAPRTLSRHSEQGSGRVLYVDQAALSQYPKRDNYLLLDRFDSDINYSYAGKRPPSWQYH